MNKDVTVVQSSVVNDCQPNPKPDMLVIYAFYLSWKGLNCLKCSERFKIRCQNRTCAILVENGYMTVVKLRRRWHGGDNGRLFVWWDPIR